MLSYKNIKLTRKQRKNEMTLRLRKFTSLSHVIKIVDFVRIYVICQNIQSGRVFRLLLQLKVYDPNKRYTF